MYQITLLINCENKNYLNFLENLKSKLNKLNIILTKINVTEKKQLGYQIKNFNEINYIMLFLKMKKEQIIEINNFLKNDKNIIRFLLQKIK